MSESANTSRPKRLRNSWVLRARTVACASGRHHDLDRLASWPARQWLCDLQWSQFDLGQGRQLSCRSRCIPTRSAIPAGTSAPMMTRTREPSSFIWGIATFETSWVTRNCRRNDLRILGRLSYSKVTHPPAAGNCNDSAVSCKRSARLILEETQHGPIHGRLPVW